MKSDATSPLSPSSSPPPSPPLLRLPSSYWNTQQLGDVVTTIFDRWEILPVPPPPPPLSFLLWASFRPTGGKYRCVSSKQILRDVGDPRGGADFTLPASVNCSILWEGIDSSHRSGRRLVQISPIFLAVSCTAFMINGPATSKLTIETHSCNQLAETSAGKVKRKLKTQRINYVVGLLSQYQANEWSR